MARISGPRRPPCACRTSPSTTAWIRATSPPTPKRGRGSQSGRPSTLSRSRWPMPRLVAGEGLHHGRAASPPSARPNRVRQITSAASPPISASTSSCAPSGRAPRRRGIPPRPRSSPAPGWQAGGMGDGGHHPAAFLPDQPVRDEHPVAQQRLQRMAHLRAFAFQRRGLVDEGVLHAGRAVADQDALRPARGWGSPPPRNARRARPPAGCAAPAAAARAAAAAAPGGREGRDEG